MFQIEKSIFIRRPQEEVFAFCEGPKTMAMWQGTLVSAEKITQGPWRVGSIIKMVQTVMGRQVEVMLEITEYDPPRKYCFTNHSQFPFSGCQTYVSKDGGTRMTLNIEAKTQGLLKLFGGVIKKQLERQAEADLNRLKEILEDEKSSI
jgi:carbon monoxide dehydrogenase subunit G